ncbi:MAG: hypothetical protein DRN30_00720 [Thermoplasmata archaeon]|nr:MAG: hypothetical protein DRN30_00720 [Thermoplasmata archaeon]
MSDFSIKDGTGKGHSALVDDHGRLYTRANMISHMSHHATYHKNAYIKSFETTLADGNITSCAFLQNTDSTKDIELYWIRVSADANVQIDAISDNDYNSGGNAVTPLNTNLGNPTSLSVLAYEGGASADLILTTTHDFLIDGRFLGAYSSCNCDYEGGIVLGNTRSFAIKATGAAGNKVKVTIGFALHDEGAKL